MGLSWIVVAQKVCVKIHLFGCQEGHRGCGLIVMALGWGSEGRGFKPRSVVLRESLTLDCHKKIQQIFPARLKCYKFARHSIKKRNP